MVMTAKQIEQFRKALFDDGMAVADAARKVGIPLKRAYYRAKAMGWSTKNRKRVPDNCQGVDRDKMRRMFDAHKSYQTIADKFGISAQRVQQIAAEMGIRRKRGRPRTKGA